MFVIIIMFISYTDMYIYTYIYICVLCIVYICIYMYIYVCTSLFCKCIYIYIYTLSCLFRLSVYICTVLRWCVFISVHGASLAASHESEECSGMASCPFLTLSAWVLCIFYRPSPVPPILHLVMCFSHMPVSAVLYLCAEAIYIVLPMVFLR